MAISFWYLMFCIGCYHVLDLLEILVAPPTLVETQCPVWGHSRSTNHFMVLLHHIIRGVGREEVQI